MAGTNGGIIGPCNAAGCSPISAKVTSFTSSGTFTAQATATVEFLAVAGGAGGGGSGGKGGGGGGGAGGYRTSFGCGCVAGKPVTRGTSYTITIGAGGAGRTEPTISCGGSGSNTVAFACTPLAVTVAGGGGGGGCVSGTQAGVAGKCRRICRIGSHRWYWWCRKTKYNNSIRCNLRRWRRWSRKSCLLLRT